MSRADDRVAVPGNGHQPTQPIEGGTIAGSPATEPPTSARSAAEVDARPALPTQVVDRRAASTVTPGQLAAGFGIIAALIVLAIRRRRGRND
jgi:hypothetical protein